MSINLLSKNKIVYLSEIKSKYFTIYWLILLMVISIMVSLPFIYLDISVKSQGIIRPKDEKTELKSFVSTTIDSIYCKEGDTVKKGDVIIQLRKDNIATKKQ